MKLPTKQKILQTARKYREDPDVQAIAVLADARRKEIRAEQTKKNKKVKEKKKKRNPKPQLKATDYFTPAQWSKIFKIIQAEPTKTVSRSSLNQMLLILLIESGLRASELCNLRLNCLPGHHGKQLIQVIDGKGKKDRLVHISLWLTKVIEDYVSRYKVGCGPECFLFRSEQGGRLSTNALWYKVKRIGLKARIWIYTKDGVEKSSLTTHTFRHSMATILLDSSGDIVLVKDALGHRRIDTTNIYAQSMPEKKARAMNEMHEKMWSKVVTDLQVSLTPGDVEKCG